MILTEGYSVLYIPCRVCVEQEDLDLGMSLWIICDLVSEDMRGIEAYGVCASCQHSKARKLEVYLKIILLLFGMSTEVYL